MNLKTAKELLKKIIEKDHLAIMLHGSVGIGKSECIKQLAEETNHKFLDIRLSQMGPQDIQGLPYPDKTRTKTNWLRPDMFPPPDSKDNYILLFDEIGLASVSVQGASYRICLDRSLGDYYTLPDGVKIIAATNKITDESFVQKMSKALANRFIHWEIEPDFESWKDWALKNNINEKIIGFLNWKPDFLFKFPKIEEYAFPTPRSWTFMSKMLDMGIDNEEALSGTVGEGTASEFFTYIEVYTKLPDIKKILKGEKVNIPKELSVQYALSSSLVYYANKKNIENIFKFCEKLPQEIYLLTIKDIICKDETITSGYSKINDWLEKYDKFF